MTTLDGQLLLADHFDSSAHELAGLEAESVPRSCLTCGEPTPLATGRRGRRPVYCSPACRQGDPSRKAQRRAARARLKCLTCGESLADRRATKYCSKRCSDIAYGNLRPEPLPERECALPDCTVVFVPVSSRTRCCSETHGKRLWWLRANADGYKNPARPWGGTRKEAYQRRRAQKKGASTGDRVVAAGIYERDRWRCQLCKKRIKRDLAWPDPMSASLDHVVPLSQGGDHDPANVQAAHLVCNTRKNNRGEPQQLALIG